MAINIKNTKDIGNDGVKALVYSRAGIGKTVLCATAPVPLVVSAEKGLLSLKEMSVPYIEVKSVADMAEAFTFITNSAEAKKFETICFDSISDMAEVALHDFMAVNKDPRNAYGKMADTIAALVRGFRDLPKVNVYIIAKSRRIVDDIGVSTFVPSAPGKQLPDALPYLFDLLMPMLVGKLADGKTYRYLQTQACTQYEAKDRSGKLDPIEEPDLTKIFNKIKGE